MPTHDKVELSCVFGFLINLPSGLSIHFPLVTHRAPFNHNPTLLSPAVPMSFLNRNNLFGGSGGQPPPRDQYGQNPSPNRGVRPSNQAPPGHDTPMNGYDSPRGYANPGLPARNMPPPRQQMGHQQNPSRGGGGGGGPPNRSRGAAMTLQPMKAPDNSYTFRNLVAVSSQDFAPSYDGNDIFLLLNGMYVLSARPLDAFPRGSIGLSEPQRSWMGVALTDLLSAEVFEPFTQGGQAYIGAMDIEVGFASNRKTTEQPYDQDDLAKEVTKVCLRRHPRGTILTPCHSYSKTRCSHPLRGF